MELSREAVSEVMSRAFGGSESYVASQRYLLFPLPFGLGLFAKFLNAPHLTL